MVLSKGSRCVKIYAEEGDAIVEIYSIERNGEKLVMDAKVLGAMRMNIVLTPEETCNGVKIMSQKLILYLLLLPYFSLRRLVRRSLG
jgi:hypothetical protein